jgi:hypothetical protein
MQPTQGRETVSVPFAWLLSERNRLAAPAGIPGGAIPVFPGPVAPRTLLAYARDGRRGLPGLRRRSGLPLAQTPCPSCTSILDSLDGAAPHLAHPLNLAVVA